MSSARRTLILVVSCLLLGGACSVGRQRPDTSVVPRAASDVPARFEVGGTPPTSGAPEACRNPLVDPRNGTHLRLVRSAPVRGELVGDYEVPPGSYGVGEGERLRVACGTGRAIGIVPR